jgi:hypothetical protein
MSRTTDKNAGGVESVLALVLYFAREGYWHHVQTVADQVIKKRGRAPVLSFWLKHIFKGVAILLHSTVAELPVMSTKKVPLR